jgi:hypothetical protein
VVTHYHSAIFKLSTLDLVLSLTPRLPYTMFSMRNPALVSHSNGIFTRYSASTNGTNSDLQNDLIAFLSVVQKCNVDFLPITWQPALGILGKGGSATISQSTFTADKHLAFKRFHMDGNTGTEESDNDFLPLISEVLILSQHPIKSHPNVVNLEGVCWEIKPRTEKAVPVLVFEKATWDLQQFMNTSEGMNLSIDDRLKICADIGNAIMVLHDYGKSIELYFGFWKSNMDTGVIHGDIKPQNVLVFKDDTGTTTVKMADFGYSTLTTNEAIAKLEGPTTDHTERVFLPKSRPWNAPEHHFGMFTAQEAKQTDVYSFGMLCLWVLFGSVRTPQNSTECMPEVVSFDAPTEAPTLLEKFKYEDKMGHTANKLIDSMPAELNVELRIRLKEVFSCTVLLNPERRTSDIGKVVHLFNKER